METWFENIRNPTIHTLMNNLDNRFWISHLNNLTTDDISQKGLVRNVNMFHNFLDPFYDQADDTTVNNPYYFMMRQLIWKFDEEKLAESVPHVSKKDASRVVATVALILWQMINMCFMLTHKMDCDQKCYQLFNTYNFYPRGLDLHDIYHMPEYPGMRSKDSKLNYWKYFKMALTRDICRLNSTSQNKCNVQPLDYNQFLSDDSIWDNFAKETFFEENRDRNMKKSASKLAYSMCPTCLSACKLEFNHQVKLRDLIYNSLCVFSLGVSTSLLTSACTIYTITPSLRRNINGKSTLCHLISLTTTVFIFFLDELISFVENSIAAAHQAIIYKITGLLIWHSTLSTFFWLNSICFDTFMAIWKGGQSLPKESTRLKAYMTYSWGLPLIITLTVIGITWNHPKLERRFFYARVFSTWKTGGWDRGGMLIRWLWDTPMGLSLLLNLLIFLATAIVLYQHSLKLRILGRGNNGCSNRVSLTRVSIYLRLFSLVGIHWILQMYGWRFNLLFPYIQIIGNFQGSITFLLLICRKSTIKAFRARNDRTHQGRLIK